MIPKDILKLMHGQIDNVNTPDESMRLERFLAENPEAQRLFDDLRRLASRLESMEELEEPLTLLVRILNSIRPIQRNRFGTLIERISSALSTSPVPRFAFFFLIGVVTGALIYAIAENQGLTGNEPIVGSFFSSTSVSGTVTDYDTINVRGTFGTIVIKDGEEHVYVEAKIVTSDKTKLSLEYEPGELSYDSFISSRDNSSGLKIDSTSVHFYTEQYGEYVVAFRKSGAERSELGATVCHEDACVYHTTLELQKKSK